jgi:nicotinamidase-related amidase
MAEQQLHLNLRRWVLAQDEAGRNYWQKVVTPQTFPASRAAIVICDMWDDHWSRGARERVEAMAPRMNEVLNTARARGVQIIHAPSETMAFYSGMPARQRMLDLPEVTPPEPLDLPDPPLPIDDDSRDCSDTGEREFYKAWRRQHPALEIDQARDGISDDGREIYNLVRQRGIEQLILMGVHTNKCVLKRSFGIKQMVKWGMPIALVRDLTDALYNPARSPYVDQAEGTRLVIEYIEKFWCPSISSTDLLEEKA